jgi:hypothetical protein
LIDGHIRSSSTLSSVAIVYSDHTSGSQENL